MGIGPFDKVAQEFACVSPDFLFAFDQRNFVLNNIAYLLDTEHDPVGKDDTLIVDTFSVSVPDLADNRGGHYVQTAPATRHVLTTGGVITEAFRTTTTWATADVIPAICSLDPPEGRELVVNFRSVNREGLWVTPLRDSPEIQSEVFVTPVVISVNGYVPDNSSNTIVGDYCSLVVVTEVIKEVPPSDDLTCVVWHPTPPA
jgi:hypothetical protein